MEIREKADSRLGLRHRFMKSYKKNTLALFSCFVFSIDVYKRQAADVPEKRLSCGQKNW